ncbi:MAG: RrF2 family transcriptional regulator, partial [bacterium]
MLSQTAEYALRAMVTLAQDEDTPLTAQEIARLARVPLDYLSKVLNLLSRAGLVKAQRGRYGGFHAAKSAGQMTVLEIVNAV